MKKDSVSTTNAKKWEKNLEDYIENKSLLALSVIINTFATAIGTAVRDTNFENNVEKSQIVYWVFLGIYILIGLGLVTLKFCFSSSCNNDDDELCIEKCSCCVGIYSCYIDMFNCCNDASVCCKTCAKDSVCNYYPEFAIDICEKENCCNKPDTNCCYKAESECCKRGNYKRSESYSDRHNREHSTSCIDKMVYFLLTTSPPIFTFFSGALYYCGDNISLIYGMQFDKHFVGFSKVKANEFRSYLSVASLTLFIISNVLSALKNAIFPDKTGLEEKKALNFFQKHILRVYTIVAVVPELTATFNIVLNELTELVSETITCPDGPQIAHHVLFAIIIITWVGSISVIIVQSCKQLQLIKLQKKKDKGLYYRCCACTATVHYIYYMIVIPLHLTFNLAWPWTCKSTTNIKMFLDWRIALLVIIAISYLTETIVYHFSTEIPSEKSKTRNTEEGQ